MNANTGICRGMRSSSCSSARGRHRPSGALAPLPPLPPGQRAHAGHADRRRARSLPSFLRTGRPERRRACAALAIPAPGFIALACGASAPIAGSCVQLLLLYAVAYSLLASGRLHESTGQVAVQLLLHLLLPAWLFVQTATALCSVHAVGIELQALQLALLGSAVIIASNSLATAAAAVLEGRVPWANRALASLPWQRPSPAAVIASTAAAAFGNPAAAPALMAPGAASGFDADTTLLRLACVSPWPRRAPPGRACTPRCHHLCVRVCARLLAARPPGGCAYSPI
jgi:hypothetical protein